MKEQQLVEEADSQPTSTTSLVEQQSKLIEYNTGKLSTLTKISMVIVIMRMVFVSVALTFDQYFLTRKTNSQYPQSWNSIVYFLASMIDSMALVNNIRVLQILNRQRPEWQAALKELGQNSQAQPQTQYGTYRNYLSYYTLIQIYRMKNKYHISYNETVSFLQIIFTFYTFGQVAIYQQVINHSTILPVISLWGFILCTYFTTYEMDFRAVEGSSGPYVEGGLEQENGVREDEKYVEGVVKKRYWEGCRKPFLKIYLFTTTIATVIIVLYLQNYLFYYMLFGSILLMMVQLIYEVHCRNQLTTQPLQGLSTIHTPYKILRKVTTHPRLHLALVTTVRLSMVLTIMASFRIPPFSSLIQFVLVALLNIGYIWSQQSKFTEMDRVKLYVLQGHKQQGESGVDCAVCLNECKNGEEVIRLPCSATHLLHGQCMRQWFKQSKQCPLCRFKLDIYDI